MDCTKTGRLIYSLRKEKGMTQRQLAQLMNISDKTVSKWERGLGSPDLSLLPSLSEIFSVNIEGLLSGELKINKATVGNMRKIKFYICAECGNIITSLTDVTVSCCGKKMKAAQAQKAEEEDRLSVEIIENEFYITTQHPMERRHYISFVAMVSGDSVMVKKLFPEWDMQVRIPRFAHGRLVWYCTNHGLFYQEIRR